MTAAASAFHQIKHIDWQSMDFTVRQLFPQSPARIFLVGIGGIGMSALAQYLRHCGYMVAGSDRALGNPATEMLFRRLERQGIRLFPQDGSGVAAFNPQALVVSTAIEDGNPDLAAFEGPVFHRAAALSEMCRRQRPARLLAIAGSCGKTSVTSWIASTLKALGVPMTMVGGGYAVEFRDECHPGNFHSDASPQFIVAEIDESDRTIDEFAPDYGLVLNIGDDHYGRLELAEEFNKFLSRCSVDALAPQELRGCLRARRYYDDAPGGYCTTRDGIRFLLHGQEIACGQCGRYSAANGAAVFELLRCVLPETQYADFRIAAAMGAFGGVCQRFQVVSTAASPMTVINDYAHNPEKIAAAISAAHERFREPLCVIFQPHGFRPLDFMRESLKAKLRETLRDDDLFLFLPVYYAGGTAQFSPTSEAVADEYASCGLPVKYLPGRADVDRIIPAAPSSPRVILVLGARDPSLYDWSCALARS